jgi:glutamine---fructose-6-phosphate transaminase (isomerizing)
MCGIFGYVGPREATSIVLAGLERLAYRGYDSAGIAVVDEGGRMAVRKASGKIENLAQLLKQDPIVGTPGLGHTRWATHGSPTDINAHPHANGAGDVIVVHNGIVENHTQLKQRLASNGSTFTSATDTEVIPQLISSYITAGQPFQEAVRLAACELRGGHAIACMHSGTPGVVAAVRIGNAGGLSIGHGEGETYLASDMPAMLPLTTSITPLAPGEIAFLNAEGCEIMDLDGNTVETARQTITMDFVSAAKGGYRHFMLKEIMEQPEAAMSALRGRLEFSPDALRLDEVPFTTAEVVALRRVVFLGMGTSLNAAHMGARFMEQLARIPATAENAAEFRYRDPVVDPETLIVAVTQSGETADTIEALYQARQAGARTLTITNVEGSQAQRAAEGALLMHAGPEIGVASTKTFVNSLLCMYLLSGYLGQKRWVLDGNAVAGLVGLASRLPGLLGEALELNHGEYELLARKYSDSRRFLFLGRGLLEPVAREGALKLKEISYIHAEGMAAAEMKHGPIALIDAETPVVAFALRDKLYEKMMSNIAEVHARSGPVISIATVGDHDIAEHSDDVLWVPEAPHELASIAAVVPVQLFAYHMAVYCGNDVDQPRNLAKSVTVE